MSREIATMKRAAIILAVLFAIAVVVGGCGKPKEQVTKTSDGKTITTSETAAGKAKIEVEGKNGEKSTTTVEKGTAVSEADLGVPVYKNLTSENHSTHDMQGKKMEIFVLSTPDSFEDVAGFYKANLKNVTNNFSTNQGDVQAETWQIGESMKGMVVSVMADKKSGKTMVTVTKYQE